MSWELAASIGGSLLGGLFGGNSSKKAAATAANAQIQAAQIAADAAKFKPWSVSTGLGTSKFDEASQTASYQLDPRVSSWRDRMYGAAESEFAKAPSSAIATQLRDYSSGLLGRSFGIDPTVGAKDYYNKMQSIMAPNRALEDSRLADQMFSTGRLGYGTGVQGGYINPQQFAMQTARAQQDESLALSSFDRARAMKAQDIEQGLGLFGSGEQMRLAPYDVAGKLFQSGIGYEQLGMDPLTMGVNIGGRQAQAGANAGQFLSQGIGAAGGYRAAGQMAQAQGWGNLFKSPEFQSGLEKVGSGLQSWWDTSSSPTPTPMPEGNYGSVQNPGIGPNWGQTPPIIPNYPPDTSGVYPSWR